MKHTLVNHYTETEKQLENIKLRLQEFLTTQFDVNNLETIKTLNFITDSIISYENRLEIYWNHMTEKEMDKVLAKAGK